MKNLFTSLCVLLLGVTTFAYAQEKSPDYRRSSLCLILMDEANMPKRDTIRDAFLSAAMPEKYNDHNVMVRCFNPAELSLTSADEAAYNAAVAAAQESEHGGNAQATKRRSGFGNLMRDVAKTAVGSVSNTVDTASKSTYAIIANKYLLEEQVAKQLFDNWFIDENGEFSMELIKERGLYDASMMDVQTAKNSIRGMGMLEDAGEELINNTFVVVSRYRYISKEELSAEISAAADLVAQQFGIGGLGQVSNLAMSTSMGAGYYVRITSFLFQLNWNDDIAGTFYSQLWGNPEAYNAADIFSLKYIGQETAWANVKAGVFTNKPEDELIRMATINATDAVLAKLEKQFDVFKTKTPLASADPMMAYIGTKEGVEDGDKYEVLERIVDPETNRTTYERKATVKVAKGQVWDNAYGAAEERAQEGEAVQQAGTRFEGSNRGLYPGMLLRQIK
jgi:hypothetical protein